MSPRRARLVFWALLLALSLAALEQLIVATALPTIAGELRGPDRMSWVITAYLLASAVGLPVCGRLGDRYGRKGVFQFAVLVFVAGSALAGRSRTMDELIAFRALQGAGAAGLMSGVQAILADIVPLRRRGRAMGLTGAAFALASVAGPLLGGWFTDHLSWRWCFYVNVPFGLLALAVVAVALRLPRPAAAPRPDVLGTLLLTAASTCLVLLAGRAGGQYAWDSHVVLGLAAGAAVSAVLFLLAEHRAAEPLVPLRLFRDGVFGVTAVVGVAVGAGLFGAACLLPTYLQLAAGATATRSGLLMLPMTGGIVGASVVAGHLIGRGGRHRIYPVLGCALSGTGMWLLSRLEADTPWLHFGVWTAVLGAGIGLVMPVLVLAAQNSAHPRDLSAATGAHTCFRQLGGAVAVAVLGTLLAERLARSPAGRPPAGTGLPDPGSATPRLIHALPAELREGYAAAYTDAMPRLFLYLVPVLVLGLLVACFLKEKPPAPHDAPAAAPETVPPTAPAGTRAPSIPGARSPYAAGVTVHGTVRHPDGTAVPRAALTLVDVAGRQIGRGASVEDGRYALPAPAPGSYVLIAAAGGHQPQAAGVTVGERPVELDVVLGVAGRLAGKVVTADGVPVRHATVTLTDAHGEVVAATRSGPEGGYGITELTAGEYTLAASAPDFRPAALPVGVRAARETRQDVELTGGALLRGTVRAGGGRPVEDARVTLLDATGRTVGTLTTGGDGAFRFADLSPGEYTVIAAGYPPVATVLRVAGGGRTERDLRLGHQD
nr:MFS transporter [Streptomyces sp. REN17]